MNMKVNYKKILSMLLTLLLRVVVCLLCLYIAKTFFGDIFTACPETNPVTVAIYALLGIPGMIAVYGIVWMGSLG